MERDLTTHRPVTVQRIERALDRVAEIIVARGDQGEAWLPLYDYPERAMQDLQAKEVRLAEVRKGAADFIEKPFDDAGARQSGRPCTIAIMLLPRIRKQRRSSGNLSKLSERERQVLDGLVSGLPDKTIAYDLGISPVPLKSIGRTS